MDGPGPRLAVLRHGDERVADLLPPRQRVGAPEPAELERHVDRQVHGDRVQQREPAFLSEVVGDVVAQGGHATGAGILQPTLQANLESYAGVVNTALDRLEVTLNSVAGRMVELNNVKETQKSLKLYDQNALGELQDLDEAAAIVELQQRQTTLQASMQAFATVSGLSLFNYL